MNLPEKIRQLVTPSGYPISMSKLLKLLRCNPEFADVTIAQIAEIVDADPSIRLSRIPNEERPAFDISYVQRPYNIDWFHQTPNGIMPETIAQVMAATAVEALGVWSCENQADPRRHLLETDPNQPMRLERIEALPPDTNQYTIYNLRAEVGLVTNHTEVPEIEKIVRIDNGRWHPVTENEYYSVWADWQYPEPLVESLGRELQHAWKVNRREYPHQTRSFLKAMQSDQHFYAKSELPFIYALVHFTGASGLCLRDFNPSHAMREPNPKKWLSPAMHGILLRHGWNNIRILLLAASI